MSSSPFAANLSNSYSVDRMAVLVAIAIPIFTKRLEGSRETTDLANLRSAYAAGQVALLSGDVNTSTAQNSWFNPDAATGLQADKVVLGKGG